MAHAISAIVAATAAIERAAPRLGGLHVDLMPGIAVIPMTETLFDQLTTGDESIEPFVTFTPSVLARIRAVIDVFGYLETDYFGGAGDQRGGAWDQATELVVPSEQPDVVNRVLRALGVVTTGSRDEWDTVELGRFRRMDTLCAAARP